MDVDALKKAYKKVAKATGYTDAVEAVVKGVTHKASYADHVVREWLNTTHRRRTLGDDEDVNEDIFVDVTDINELKEYTSTFFASRAYRLSHGTDAGRRKGLRVIMSGYLYFVLLGIYHEFYNDIEKTQSFPYPHIPDGVKLPFFVVEAYHHIADYHEQLCNVIANDPKHDEHIKEMDGLLKEAKELPDFRAIWTDMAETFINPHTKGNRFFRWLSQWPELHGRLKELRQRRNFYLRGGRKSEIAEALNISDSLVERSKRAFINDYLGGMDATLRFQSFKYIFQSWESLIR